MGRAPAPALRERPAASGDGLEVVRATYALNHRHGRCVLGDALRSLGGADAPDLSATVWLDTETTGLAGGTGTYAFLVGLAYLEGERLVTEQLLLRRLSGEPQLLTVLAQRLERARRLVTFNGQRFDWPILEARFVLARRRPATLEVHTDLIHPARRLWHRVFGTHRLSTLEAEVLGAPRHGDVPGWEIPMIYVEYLRSTDRAALDPVIAHNRADLL
ncbi:MAG TPA: ribonuclease H-like domain-containing protein, partial [bacterium]|nr:ribonuclease H-like domain-containing protein [bacterium]